MSEYTRDHLEGGDPIREFKGKRPISNQNIPLRHSRCSIFLNLFKDPLCGCISDLFLVNFFIELTSEH